MIRVSVVGAKGRMGSHVVAAVEGAADMQLALALDAGDDLTAISPENTDVVVEFTVPSVALGNVLTLVKQGVNVVVGTTGWTEDKLNQVSAALTEAGNPDQSVFIAPNFAISAVLADHFARVAAPYFESAEVVELHHPNKVDAPSGTALMLANAAKSENSEIVAGRHGSSCKRKDNEISISSVRGGTIVGEHDVMFIGDDEILTLSHTALSRKLFALGALKAALFMADKKSGMYDMNDVLGL